MAKGLLPARRVAGMAASAASPETAASTAIGASTSIKASRPGFRSRAGSGGSRLESNTGSWRSTMAWGSATHGDLRLARRVPARGPGVVGHQGGQHQAAQDRQAQRKTAQAASAMDTADSMSTATMRETPCSCIVTPISCSAISMAILLWLMKRNWVPRLMLVTSLA